MPIARPIDVESRIGLHQLGRAIGGEADHRGDRQVDVAGDQHQHLCDGDDHAAGRRPCRAADQVGAAQHARVDDGDREDDGHHRRDQPELAPGGRRAQPAAAGRSVGAIGPRPPAAWPPPAIGAARRGRLSVAACRAPAPGSPRSRASSAVTRPSRSTRMRSHMPISSGSSDEIRRIARPCAREIGDHRVDLGLGLTSMPWVGSSRISTRGPVREPFATAPPSAGCRPTAS